MTYSSNNKWVERNFTDAYWFQEGPGIRNWQFTDSGMRFIRVVNITEFDGITLNQEDRYISHDEPTTNYKHFLLDEGDLVIASSGISFDSNNFLRVKSGFIQKSHLPLCLNTGVIRFKAKENISDLNFLRFWFYFSEFRQQIKSLITGIAQQHFGPSHLNQIKISLPPLAEQRRIAAIAQKADRLRRTRRYALQLSDTYLRSVFLEMFGDPATNPKGWEIVKLSSLGELDRGRSKHRPRNAPELFGGTYPFIQTGDVANSAGYVRTYKQTYSELGLKQSKLWTQGTLCITIAANIAKTGILTFDAW